MSLALRNNPESQTANELAIYLLQATLCLTLHAGGGLDLLDAALIPLTLSARLSAFKDNVTIINANRVSLIGTISAICGGSLISAVAILIFPLWMLVAKVRAIREMDDLARQNQREENIMGVMSAAHDKSIKWTILSRKELSKYLEIATRHGLRKKFLKRFGRQSDVRFGAIEQFFGENFLLSAIVDESQKASFDMAEKLLKASLPDSPAQ